MSRSNGRTAKECIEAIQGSGGVKTAIAQRLRITRQTLDRYLGKWDSVREAFEAEQERFSDMAQSVVMEDITERRSVETAKWWLRMRRRDEFHPKDDKKLTGDPLAPIEIMKVDYRDSLAAIAPGSVEDSETPGEN